MVTKPAYPMRTSLRLAVALTGLILVLSCNRRPSTGDFNPDNLSTFTVDIDVTRDTVIKAPGGSILRIPAGALDAGGTTQVKLLIKEALTISDIIRAGLETRSNGQALSSGGMIDIEPAPGENVTIRKEIGVSLPSPFLNKDMQVYKGKTNAEEKLDWTDPTPMTDNPQLTALDSGKLLYTTHCASCHAGDKEVVGPSLAYIDKRRKRAWLYAWTRNNQRLLESEDPYARCIYCQYNKQAMNDFPNLTDRELDQLYTYIDNDCAARGVPFVNDHLQEHMDSCQLYKRLSDSLTKQIARQTAANKTHERVEVTQTMPAGYVSGDTGTIAKVSPPSYPTLYYQFTIKTFGWYNIDILLKNLAGVKNSQLMVRLRGAYTSEINVSLIIPDAKVFDNGGRLNTGPDDYGFYTEDGQTPLLQGLTAYVLAMGEQDGKAIFSMTTFQTTESQTLILEPKPIEKDEMNAQLDKLNFQGINMQVKDMPNVDSLRKAHLTLDSINRWRPKNCDCGCQSDTSAEEPPIAAKAG